MATPAYTTPYGTAYCGNSLDFLDSFPDRSVPLFLTSPPFALQRPKAYGNETQDVYVDWLLQFCRKVKRKMRDDGSFVMDLGGAYVKGAPVRSLYMWEALIRCCDELGFHLAEEFYWQNPAKLPSPAQWVTIERVRCKDSVNAAWWLSHTEEPYADFSQLPRCKEFGYPDLDWAAEHYGIPKEHLADHPMFALPTNLLTIANTASNTHYRRMVKRLGLKAHPATFPNKWAEFFIRSLTRPGDLVVDIFGGSSTTGEVAEEFGRQWTTCELRRDYVASSVLRFSKTLEEARHNHSAVMAGRFVDLREMAA